MKKKRLETYRQAEPSREIRIPVSDSIIAEMEVAKKFAEASEAYMLLMQKYGKKIIISEEDI